jgi:VCBS repeat-containing protein
VTRCSLNLSIANLDATTGVISKIIGVGPVPGQVAITPDGKYTYEADMDGVSVTKSKTGLVSKTIKTDGTDLRHLLSGVAITRTASI